MNKNLSHMRRVINKKNKHSEGKKESRRMAGAKGNIRRIDGRERRRENKDNVRYAMTRMTSCKRD